MNYIVREFPIKNPVAFKSLHRKSWRHPKRTAEELSKRIATKITEIVDGLPKVISEAVFKRVAEKFPKIITNKCL